MIKPRLAIIDADMFIYLAGWAFHDQLTKLGAMAAKKQMDNLLNGIIKKLDVDYYLGFFGALDGRNFRYDVGITKPYKGHRKSPDWQEYFKPILKGHMEKKWGFYPMNHIEADDAVIIAHHQYKDDYDITHIGEDKDQKQLGKFKRYNPRTKSLEHHEHFEGRKFFWKQMLHGDSSDNIGGVKGVGAKSKYVQQIDEMDNPSELLLYNHVYEVYLLKYGEDAQDMMVENYLLLNMLTEPRFDYPKDIKLTPVEKEQMYTTPDIIDI